MNITALFIDFNEIMIALKNKSLWKLFDSFSFH